MNLHKEQGIEALRIPLSGSMTGFKNDVVIKGLEGECKVRGHGFKQLYEWLGIADFLAVKADNKEWMIVLPLKTWLSLIKGRKA